MKNKMSDLSMGKLIFNMSLPLIVSMLIQALYNIVDSMFIAGYSKVSLEAVSLCAPIQMIIIAVSVGCGIGVQANLGRCLGAQNTDEANNIAMHGIFIALFNALLFMLFGMFASRLFIQCFTDDLQIIKEASSYLRICCIFSFGVFVQITYERYMQATGNSFYNLIIQGIGAIINIILDPIFIFGYFGLPEMGIEGAAYATVTGQIIGMFIGIYVTNKKVKQLNLKLSNFKFDISLLKRIYRIAIPAMVVNSIMSIMTVFMNMLLISFSTIAVSVYGILSKLQQFLYMGILGLSNAVIAIVSYNYGAKKYDRVIECIKLSFRITIVSMIIGTVIFLCFPNQLLSMFHADQQMIDIGYYALTIVSLSFISGAINILTSSILQTLDKSLISLIITILRQLVIILPLCYLLGHTFGLNYLWLSFPITEFIVCIISIKLIKDIISNLKTI